METTKQYLLLHVQNTCENVKECIVNYCLNPPLQIFTKGDTDIIGSKECAQTNDGLQRLLF